MRLFISFVTKNNLVPIQSTVDTTIDEDDEEDYVPAEFMNLSMKKLFTSENDQ